MAFFIPLGTAAAGTSMFHNNAQHTGDYSSSAGTTIPNGQPIWSYRTGYIFDSSPVIADGVVYIGTLNGLYAFNAAAGTKIWTFVTGGTETAPAIANGIVYIGGNHDLWAIRAATGEKLWNFTAGDVIYSSPTIDNGSLYFGSHDGNLYALNATTGSELWRFPTGVPVISSPAVTNGTVYIGTDGGYRVFAINATTGTVVWSFVTDGGIGSSPAIDNDVVYINGFDHTYALDAINGTVIWSVTGWSEGSPALGQGMIFTTDDYSAVALNRTTGTRIWSYNLGGSSRSSPAYANGIIYIGSHDRNLYALNATTGEKIWNYKTRNSIYSSPAVSNGLVYVGSMDGDLYAIGNRSVSSPPRTGPLSPGGDEVMFRFDSSHAGDYSPVAGNTMSNGLFLWNSRLSYNPAIGTSAPTVANGKVFLASDDLVYALNKRTGDILWWFGAGNRIESAPAVSNGMVFIGSYDRNLYALDATDGVKIWNFSVGSVITSPPVVSAGTVYFGAWNGNLYALNTLSGTKIWNSTTGGQITSSPAVADGRVFTGSTDGNLYAFDLTGSKVWNFTTQGSLWSSPAVADHVVFFGSDDGKVYAVNATTGTKIWNFSTGGMVRSSPAVVNGVLYIGSFDENLYALNATTGSEIWQYPIGDSRIGSPAVVNNVLYIGGGITNSHYEVSAINAITGEKIWSCPADYPVYSPVVSDGVVYFTGYFDNVYAIGNQVPSKAPVVFDNAGPDISQPDDSSPIHRQEVTSSETVNVGGNSAIRRVTVTGIGVSDIVITGLKKDGVPAGVPPLENPVYQYVDLSPAHFTSIQNALIEFDIPLSWLDDHHVTARQVSLMRYNEKSWEQLPTTVLKTGNGRSFLTAECPGFSLFAMSVDNETAAVPEATAVPVTSALVAENTKTIPKLTNPTPARTEAPLPPPQSPADPGFPFPVVFAGILGIAGVSTGGLVVRRWWIRRQNPALFREYD